MSWYRAGTVAVTNGSKTVTGVGTLWTTAVNAGDAFALVDANLNPTGAWYEVESVTNNTTLVLKQSYAGSTGSNKQYCVFNLVGNMTTPSFAQRLATFFASFQTLLDKPTSTPTALGIPIADANGKIDSGWIKDASETVAGVVELATPAEVLAGGDTERAVTPAGFKAAFDELLIWGSISGTLADQTDLQSALDGKQSVSEKDQPGGYAGLDANGALNSKIRSTYISDFNTATIGGFYYWGSFALNAPLSGTGTALVIDRLHNANLTQIAFSMSHRCVYIRYSTDTSNTEWTDWKRLDETTWGSISGTLADQTDLQAALDGKQSVSEKDQPGGYAGLDENRKLVSPAMTGSATLNGTTNNTVQLTGIVTTLGLEVGDVIRIQYSGYDKLHTVESITDDNSIIVNYEHAGNRGDGSLRLEDKTTTVTITRIAKWYNAPIGLGQAPVDVTGLISKNTNRLNSTGRAVQVYYSAQHYNTSYDILIDNRVILSYKDTGSQAGNASFIVNNGQAWKSTGWYELFRIVEVR